MILGLLRKGINWAAIRGRPLMHFRELIATGATEMREQVIYRGSFDMFHLPILANFGLPTQAFDGLRPDGTIWLSPRERCVGQEPGGQKMVDENVK